MNSRKVILLLGVGAFTASVLFPPWTYTFDHTGTHSRRSAGYHFLLNQPKPEVDVPSRGVKLDISRLCLEWAAIGGLCILGLVLTGSFVPKPQSAAGKELLRPESTPTSKATTQPKRQSSLTPEQIDELSKTVSEAVKSRFDPERHSQAERIVQQAVLAQAQINLQHHGNLSTFPTGQVVEQEIARYASEYTTEKEPERRSALSAAPTTNRTVSSGIKNARSQTVKVEELSPKSLKQLRLWSVGFLAFSFAVSWFVLKDARDQEAAGRAITEGLMLAGALSWFVWRGSGKRKGYGLLAFAVVCTILSLIIIVLFLGVGP